MIDIITACAPTVAPETMQWVIRMESNRDPLAININTPDGPMQPPRRPKDAQDAAEILKPYLAMPGYSADVGLMQISSTNFKKFGLTVEQAFDPCVNLTTGAKLLTDAYSAAVKTFGPTPYAFLAALSRYNTGNLQSGFSNGYVARYTRVWGLQANGDHSTPAAAAARKEDTHIPIPDSEDISHAKTQESAGFVDSAIEPTNMTTTVQEPKMANTRIDIPNGDDAGATSGTPIVTDQLADVHTPGVQVEVDEEQIAERGLVPETGLSFAAAWDSNVDTETSVPSLSKEAGGHGK